MLEFILPLVGNALDAIGTNSQNAANAKQAQKNRDFQERMSSTAVQRAVKDYAAAGLNPALAYGQGGASSPTGSTAQMENTLKGTANSAANAAQNLANLRETQARTAATLAAGKASSAAASKTAAETALLEGDKLIRDATDEQSGENIWRGAQIAALRNQRRIGTASAEDAENNLYKSRAYRDFYKDIGRQEPYGTRAGITASIMRGYESAAARAREAQEERQDRKRVREIRRRHKPRGGGSDW